MVDFLFLLIVLEGFPFLKIEVESNHLTDSWIIYLLTFRKILYSYNFPCINKI